MSTCPKCGEQVQDCDKCGGSGEGESGACEQCKGGGLLNPDGSDHAGSCRG
jgi:hypothetical protein